MALHTGNTSHKKRIRKKTSIGRSVFTKTHNSGGGTSGSTKSKKYKKKYRGQGR